MKDYRRLLIYTPVGGLVGGLISFFSLAVKVHHYSWVVFLAGFALGVVATIVIGVQILRK